jgi:ubiquinone/menaquinone biosynthesis C-methylase UbiE
MSNDGTYGARVFYDEVGWREEAGVTVDQRLFGDRETGPLRDAAHRERLRRTREALSSAGVGLRLLECGCGGNPARGILDLCAEYTGVDFSSTGLEVAARRLGDPGIPITLREADICALPFADGSFDAVYSAHVLYHVEDPAAQRRAFREIARVVRPGGVAVLILANPRPLLFWGRMASRLAADTPWLSGLLNRARSKPPLPYRPMTLRWMRDVLSDFGDVEISCHALASTWFNQHVTETRGAGRLLWEAILLAERRAPERLASLGCYVQIVLRKRAPSAAPDR